MAYNVRIKELREDHDLTQTAVAELLGTEQSYYAKYENGKHQLPIQHLITLCNYYKVSADYILGLNKGLKWPREEKNGHSINLTKYTFLFCPPDILGATHLGCPLSLQTTSIRVLPKIVIETR